MNRTEEQEARLGAIQQRRRKLPRRRGAIPAWASIEDVEEFVRLIFEEPRTVYIYELGHARGYGWIVWDPAEMAHEGVLVKTVTLEPEPRR